MAASAFGRQVDAAWNAGGPIRQARRGARQRLTKRCRQRQENGASAGPLMRLSCQTDYDLSDVWLSDSRVRECMQLRGYSRKKTQPRDQKSSHGHCVGLE